MLQIKLFKYVIYIGLITGLYSCSNSDNLDKMAVIPTDALAVMSLDMKNISYQIAWESFTNWEEMNKIQNMNWFNKIDKPEDLGLDLLEHYFFFINHMNSDSQIYLASVIPVSEPEKFKDKLHELEKDLQKETIGGKEFFENDDMAFYINQKWILAFFDIQNKCGTFQEELTYLLNLSEHKNVATKPEIKNRIFDKDFQSVIWVNIEKILKSTGNTTPGFLRGEITNGLRLVSGIKFLDGLMQLDLSVLVNGNELLETVSNLGKINEDILKHYNPSSLSNTVLHVDDRIWKPVFEKFSKTYEPFLTSRGVDPGSPLKAIGNNILISLDSVFWENKMVYDYRSEKKVSKPELKYHYSFHISLHDKEIMEDIVSKLPLIYKQGDYYNFFGGMAYFKLENNAMLVSNNLISLEHLKILNSKQRSSLLNKNFYHHAKIHKISNVLNSKNEYKWSGSLQSLGQNIEEIEIMGFDIHDTEFDAKMKIICRNKEQSSLFQFMKIAYAFSKQPMN